MRRLFNIEFVKGFKKTFTEQIIHQSYQTKDSLSGKELVSLTPSKQLNFLIMKALFQEWQEEMKRLESPYFDYKHADVKKALVQFMNVLSQHIQVNSGTLEELISKALDEAFVLVTDPAEFIRQEFSGKEKLSYQPKHAKPILKYLKLLTEELDDFFNAQASGTYAEVFEIAEDYFADVDLSDCQEKFFADLSEVTSITIEELLDEEEFVDITRIEDDLEEEAPEPEESEPEESEPEESEPEELEPIATETPDPEEEPVPDVTEEETEEAPAEETPVEEVEPVEEQEEEETPEPEVETTDPEPEPEITEEPEVGAPEPIGEPEPEEVIPENPTINDQFSEAKESLAEKLEKEEVPGTILSSVSVNQKYMFVQELFNGDANTFQKGLSEIEHSGSFDDAVEHLVTNYARQFDWDMNSDEVKELLKVIFRRFR